MKPSSLGAWSSGADISALGGLRDPLGLLRLPRSVVFGAGQRRSLGAAAAQVGSCALICTDERLVQSAELGAAIDDMRASGLKVSVYGRTPAELPVAAVLDCVSSVTAGDIDVVIGLGGGSCLDMAKVVSLLLAHGGQPAAYYGENKVPRPTLPVIAVPTTAGTGSEATPVAVLSDPARAVKVGISSPYLIPHTAICDPELTYSCPPSLTAAAGADALTHLIESFTAVRRPVTPMLSHERVFVGKSAFTDSIALTGLALIRKGLVAAYLNPSDTQARAAVMAAALAGGIALGTAGTAAAHALQYPIGAMTHTSHGLGVGTLLPYVMRYNLPSRVTEFAQIGRVLGCDDTGDEATVAQRGVLAVDALLDALGIPPSLQALGLEETLVPEVAALALGASRLIDNNPRTLDLEALVEITEKAFAGDRAFAVPRSR